MGMLWPQRIFWIMLPLWYIPLHSVHANRQMDRGEWGSKKWEGQWRKADESLLQLLLIHCGLSLIKVKSYKLHALSLLNTEHVSSLPVAHEVNDSPALHLKALSCICCSLSWALHRPWTAALHAMCQIDQEHNPLKCIHFMSQSVLIHRKTHNMNSIYQRKSPLHDVCRSLPL